MRERAFARIGHLYPKVDLPDAYGGGQATVIAWIWARTVPSPDPAFADVQVPLASSFLLSSKKGKEAWVHPVVDRNAKTIRYEIRTRGTVEEIAKAKKGTKEARGANFRCLLSDTPILPAYVKQMGSEGKMGLTMLSVVAKGERGRVYTAPSDRQVNAADVSDTSYFPEIEIARHPQYMGVRGYGARLFGDLFTKRQLEGLNSLSEALTELCSEISSNIDSLNHNIDEGYARSVVTYLAMLIDQQANQSSTVCSWNNINQQMISTFSMQALPMVWCPAECNIFSGSTGSWNNLLERQVKAISLLGFGGNHGAIAQLDARDLEEKNRFVISTDPPYYDNIPYSDLSDFFISWIRKNLINFYPEICGTISAPKYEELVADRVRHDGVDNAELYFMNGMSDAISNMAEASISHFPITIYYAFKQNEIEKDGLASKGWHTFLDAILLSGLSVVGTWPIKTEVTNKLKAKKNALANSVVLVCRKRPESAETITRADFLNALKRELPAAIANLQEANLSPADMSQSAIGPGMGVFSRYAAVLEADDSPMTVKTALQLINAELDSFLNDLQGDFDEDTRFAVTWFEQHGYGQGDYGSANSLAQARGISVESVKHAGIVESAAGKVRLLQRDEIPTDWNPDEDTHLTIWECCQHLIRVLETEGEQDAAWLLKKIGPDRAENTKELAYLLYDMAANKRSDAKEGTAYNGLIFVWGDLVRQAATIRDEPSAVQETMQL